MRRLFANLVLKLIGWRAEGEAPAHKKCVLVAAPHTSNWDFVLLLLFSYHFGFKMRWMGKKSLFRGPLGWLLLRLGGVSIDRKSKNNVVQQMAMAFEQSTSLCLVIPPEGTRGLASYWKSGFYHIAREASVPIVLSVLDYEQKVGCIGPAVWPSGDIRADMDIIRPFYTGSSGRFKGAFGPVRLRDEDEVRASHSAA